LFSSRQTVIVVVKIETIDQMNEMISKSKTTISLIEHLSKSSLLYFRMEDIS